MPNVRLTAYFKDDDGHGWSETHDIDGGGSPDLTAILTAFDSLMTGYRRPLLAGDAFYIGCRASFKLANGAIAGDNLEHDPAVRGPQTYMGATLAMTAPEVAVKIRLRNAFATARSDVYLRGMWSQVVNFGVLDFVSNPASEEWKRRLDAYIARLITGRYGWVGLNPITTSRGAVTGFARNPDGTVTLNCTATNAVPIPAAGTRLPVKFARINGSKSIMNRAFACVVDAGAASFTTTEIVNPDPWVVGGTYIATQTFLNFYGAMSYARLSRRKTGRPFGVGPGRARVAVLH